MSDKSSSSCDFYHPNRPAPPKPVAKPGKVKVVRALRRYNAQHADELSFEEGDTLCINDCNASSHSDKVYASCGDKKGWIPLNHVQDQVELVLPLHEAARRGNVSFMQQCLKGGVSATGLDSSGNTPLYWAVRCGHAECVNILLDLPNPPINAQNKMGDTPLHVAASHGHDEVLNILLDNGCDTTLRNNLNLTAEELSQNLAIKNRIQSSRQKYELNMHNYEQDYDDSSD